MPLLELVPVESEAHVREVRELYLEYEKAGWPIEKIEPGANLDMRDAVKYFIGKVDRTAKDSANADPFLAFMKTREAQAIYARYGFVPGFPAQ